MTSPATTALIFALGVWLAPPAADSSATGITGITLPQETPIEFARQRRLPKCSRMKRAPCEMLLPEQDSSDTV
jgi:hypothetical protein